MSDRPYSRVYHELAEEYPAIYDSNDLAGYVRLLIAADQAHPSRARWSGYVSRNVLDRLAACGLVVVDGARFAIKGMDKERAARAEKARLAAYASHAPGSARSSAQSLPKKDEKRRDETRRDWDEQGSGVFDTYYRLTTRTPSPGATTWLNRLASEHGDGPLIVVMALEWKASPDLSTFLGRVQTRLADRALAESRDAEERRRRREQAKAREYEMPPDATPEQVAAAEKRKAEIDAFVKSMGAPK